MATQHSVSPLFRREAIEFQQHQRQWGDVSLLQPVSTKLLTWSLAVSVALIIVFLMFAEYARKDTVNGYLTPSAGTAKVFAPQGGVIEDVYVKEGQQVTQGQPLLRVATDQLSGGGEDVNAVTLGLLTSRRDSLSGQIAAEEQRMSSEQQRLNASLDNLKNETSLLHNQMTIQVQRVKSGEILVSMASTLAAKGLMSEVDRIHREQAVLDDTQRLSSMAQQATSLQDRTSQTRYELEQLATVTATKLQPLRSELSSTEQRIAEIGARRASANANLEAVLFVPARAAGFVHEGQHVRLLYDAFPYQKYGTHSGRIIGISQTILTGADVSGPIALKEPAYKAIVALDEAAITTRDKKTIPLQPDMLLRADIILEQRTIMSWILEPLLSARM